MDKQYRDRDPQLVRLSKLRMYCGISFHNLKAKCLGTEDNSCGPENCPLARKATSDDLREHKPEPISEDELETGNPYQVWMVQTREVIRK
ncbi:hypothetical protein HN832_02440 [archaeon]|jgi:hypothetical protein|nr:hypothetical protein [archaeon]MBT4373213.1 hypothetical protein [archaeon]MBT4531558.1 hypothetical protein [archaeon]MBT7001264.1 hypothetical protein [archaeon]MBT7282250.1 hypothetical protein [archaeon]